VPDDGIRSETATEEIRRMSVYQRQTLSNGLRVLTAPLDHAQSVACYVFLAAGSRYEHSSNRGIAHFAEHMFFKGTERRPTAKDISLAVEGMGGEFNAFTSKEYTGYYIRCAGEQRDTALDVLVDMVRNSRFDPVEIDREKGVIVEEMNMYFDTPRDYVGSVYEELLFGSNPLGWDTLGTKETVTGATRETFLDYLGSWYTPQRMVVGVAGKVGDGLLPLLESLLGDLSANGHGAPVPAELPVADGPRVRIHHKDSDQAQVCLGVPSYPLEHPDRYALQLLATVLGGGMSSRLFLEVRERRGLAYYVFGTNSSFTDAGTLYSQAGVDLFHRIADERVPDDELEKARALAKGRFVLQTEAPNGLILFGLRREVLEGSAVEPEQLLAGLDAVTAEDIQRVAQDVIGTRGLSLALIGPFDDEQRFLRLLA
jgi:predicted Zn-dependent peptidase